VKFKQFPFTQRIKNLLNIIESKGVDAALILKPENTYYFSLFQAIIYTRPIAVFIPAKNEPTLIVPYLDLEHAKEKSPIPNIVAYYREEEFYSYIKEVLTKSNIRKIGVDTDSFKVLNWLNEIVQPINILNEIAMLRAIKDEAEIERIKFAAYITDLGMKTVVEGLQEREPEILIAVKAEAAMKSRLAEMLGEEANYPWMNWTVSAVLSGPRSFYPHGMVSGRKVKEGDIVIATLDIAVEGYRAENERTFVVGKIIDDKVVNAFNAMEEAQSVAINMLKPGKKAEEVDLQARKVLENKGYLNYMKHRTGHAIGLEIHEPPYLAEGDRTVIKENMVFCVEPGIYLPKIGGFRHSDTVLISSQEPEQLTRTLKGINNLFIR